jgi:hypothetical protein
VGWGGQIIEALITPEEVLTMAESEPAASQPTLMLSNECCTRMLDAANAPYIIGVRPGRYYFFCQCNF